MPNVVMGIRWRFRFLVALCPVRDLLLRAKHLFVAAIGYALGRSPARAANTSAFAAFNARLTDAIAATLATYRKRLGSQCGLPNTTDMRALRAPRVSPCHLPATSGLWHFASACGVDLGQSATTFGASAGRGRGSSTAKFLAASGSMKTLSASSVDGSIITLLSLVCYGRAHQYGLPNTANVAGRVTGNVSPLLKPQGRSAGRNCDCVPSRRAHSYRAGPQVPSPRG